MGWRDLLAYWREKHIGHRPPARAEIDPPLEIPQLLANLILIQREGERFRLRLVGSELTSRAGMDRTGRIFDPAIVEPVNTAGFVVLLDKVVATKAPLLFSIGANNETASGAIGLLLPLVEPSGEVDMVLGGVFYELDPWRDPVGPWLPLSLGELVLEDELARGESPRTSANSS
jgi:hypothetical protein